MKGLTAVNRSDYLAFLFGYIKRPLCCWRNGRFVFLPRLLLPHLSIVKN
ncbi:MAG: hypothetical protein IPG51_07940 [Chloroflexi bacterium]|nr:hypothetical protein [Chloroflexota bacterium]